MNRKENERLPQVVEERLREAYDAIRKGEIKQMKKRTLRHGWAGAAAIMLLLIALPSAALAAAGYFQKSTNRQTDRITYDFEINYELVPGEYQVTAGYLPEDFKDMGDGKYNAEDGQWITVMPLYTTAGLDREEGRIVVENVEKVEHAVLSGMEADIITFPEEKKSRSATCIYLFNKTEGYVLQIVADCPINRKERMQGELLQFADNLTVTRIGDDSYETEAERTARKEAEKEEAIQMLEEGKTWAALMEAGIPQDKIYGKGEELLVENGAYGFTLINYEYLDNISGFESEKFFDFTRFDGWVNEDGTLKPYTRLQYDSQGKIADETLTQQEILRIDMKAHCYEDRNDADVLLNFALEYVEQRPDGSYTWAKDLRTEALEGEYYLQMDNSAVYFDKAVHTQGENRGYFFYRGMKKGEELFYTLLFVVDKDREGDFFLNTLNGNYSMMQLEWTVQEMQDGLDGYIRLD